MYKRIAIVGVVLIISLAFWFTVNPWIGSANTALGDVRSWLWPLAWFLLFVAVLGLAFMFLEGLRWRLGVLTAANIPFLFAVDTWMLVLPAAVILVVLLQWYVGTRIADETTARRTVNTRRILGAGVGSIVTTLLIAISVVYFSTPAVQTSAQKEQLPPMITKAVQTAARQVAALQLTDLPPAQRSQTENEIARIVLGQINAWIKPYVKYLPPVLAFGLFLVLSAFGFIFQPLALLIASGIFSLLKMMNFVSIAEKEAKAEVLVL